jgi:two-component system, cell cycle response regulator
MNSQVLAVSETALLYDELSRARLICARANNVSEARAALQADEPPRTLIIDGDASDELAQQLWALLASLGDAKPHVLFVTARTDEAHLANALHRGADDVLTRPFDATALQLRVAVGARFVEMRERLVSVRSHLHFLATHDALTGAWNKSAILGFLYRETARAARDGTELAVLMCDVDHFKSINDRFGHPAGDEILRGLAGRLQSLVRPYDAIGRYGGEEFLVLLPGCEGTSACEIAQRMVEHVRARVATPTLMP